MQMDFPGDAHTGALTGATEWREWFFARHAGLACPVLDPATGACMLYTHRPICCRIYGPLVQIGNATSDPCHLCYVDATPEQVESTRVRVDFPGSGEPERETVIAYALSPCATRFGQSGHSAPPSSSP